MGVGGGVSKMEGRPAEGAKGWEGQMDEGAFHVKAYCLFKSPREGRMGDRAAIGMSTTPPAPLSPTARRGRWRAHRHRPHRGPRITPDFT